MRNSIIHQKIFFGVKVNTINQALGVFLVFVLIFPTALTNLALLLLIISVIISGDYFEKWRLISLNQSAKISLTLLGLFAVGISYSSTSISQALKVLGSYRELILFPLAMLVFEDEKWQKRAYYAFLIAILIAVLASFMMKLGWLPEGSVGEEWVPFKSRIAFGFFLAYASYLTLHHAIRAQSFTQKTLWIVFSVAIIFDLLYLVSGRTGHIVFVALLALLLLQNREILLKHGLVIFLVLISIFSTVVLTSQAIKSRSSDVALAIESPETSSIGLRLIFWESSLRIIADYPLLGAGTGSFANEFLTHANGYETLKADNPHNEYLLIACQLGIVGLGIFLWLLYSLFNESKRMPVMYGSAVQGLVVAMAVGCMFNSFLRDHGEGHFFAIYAGMLFSAIVYKRMD